MKKAIWALVVSMLAIPALAQSTYYATPQFACHIYSYGETACYENLKGATGTLVGLEVISLFGKDNTNPASATVSFYSPAGNLESSNAVTLTSPTSGTFSGGSLTWTLQTVRCKCGYKGSWSTLTYLSGTTTLQ